MTLEKKFLIEGQNIYYGVGATGIPNSENKLGLSFVLKIMDIKEFILRTFKRLCFKVYDSIRF